jgi:hypothetical protein
MSQHCQSTNTQHDHCQAAHLMRNTVTAAVLLLQEPAVAFTSWALQRGMVAFHTAESLQPVASVDSASADVQLARSMTAVFNLLHQLAQRSPFYAPNDALTRHLGAAELAAITALDAEQQCVLSLNSSSEAAAELCRGWQQRRQQKRQQRVSCDASAAAPTVSDAVATEPSADIEQLEYDDSYAAVQ